MVALANADLKRENTTATQPRKQFSISERWNDIVKTHPLSCV